MNELRTRFEQNRKLMGELKEVNKKLEESEVLKSQFLSNIRNEINNPFAAIMGLSQNILHMDKDESEKTREAAFLIFKEAFKLDYQLKNIFAAAELEAGELVPESHEVNLHALLKELVEKLQHKADEKEVRLKLTFEVEPVEDTRQTFIFRTDSHMLSLILSNLVGNAIEFSAPGSLVWLSIIRLGEGVSISVKDSGIGIPPEKISAIFDRFAQLDHGMTKQFQGHGLGLSVAKALAELLNARITVGSTPKAGSTFTLFLPEQAPLFEEEDFTINEDGIFL